MGKIKHRTSVKKETDEERINREEHEFWDKIYHNREKRMFKDNLWRMKKKKQDEQSEVINL